jgi:glycosyltransferase involved in cell wall biosynthesis
MNLLLLFDHRFFRAKNGTIFSDKSYHYSFFKSRYLKAFDRISILARVADANCYESSSEGTEGDGVSVIALRDWVGPLGYVRNSRAIVNIALREASKPSALIIIAPGGIGSAAYKALRQNGYPVALEVVGDPWEAFQPSGIRHPLRPILRRWLTRTLRQQCSQACAVSYVTKKFLQSRYPSPGFSVGVSDVVLSGECFVSRPRHFLPEPCERTVISVAVMNGFKGHKVMIDALRICKDMNVRLNLVMVGDGPLRSEIAHAAEEKGVGDSVRFAGQLPAGGAIRRELDRADLFILPSLTEGMPRALLEAMARALPALASRVGGIPEVLDSEFLVPPGNARALAEKLRTALSKPDKLSEMSARNLNQAYEFEDSILSTKRQEFYRQVRLMAERGKSSRHCPVVESGIGLATPAIRLKP